MLKNFLTSVVLLVVVASLAYIPVSPVSKLDLVSAAANGTGMYVYDEDGANNTTPHYRTWSGSDLSAESQAQDDESASDDTNHTIVASSPTRNEYIMGRLEVNGHLDIQVFNGSSWSNGTNAPTNGNFTTGIGTTNDVYRGFDIAYEDGSGDAIVVYESSSTGDGLLKYRTWDGNSWSSEASIDYSGVDEGNDVARWVECDSDHGSDYVLCAWREGTNLGVYGAAWDGSAWQHISAINTANGTSTRQDFDVAWEGTSGEGMVVYGLAATPFVDASTYTKGVGWVDTSGMPTLTGASQWISIAGSPNHDYIAAYLNNVSSTTAADVDVDMWNGSNWTTVATPATMDDDINNTGYAHAGDVAWEQGGGDRALFVWRDGTVSELLLRYMFYDISANQWQAIEDGTQCANTEGGAGSVEVITSLAAAEDAAGPCTAALGLADSFSGVKLAPDPASNKIMVLAEDLTLDLAPELFLYNGDANATWTQTATMAAPEIDLSTGATLSASLPTRPYDFAYRESSGSNVFDFGTQTTTLYDDSVNQHIGGGFAINTTSGTPNVTSITINETGTVDGQTNLDNIKLYYENDTSAPYNCASESYGGIGGETQLWSTDADGFSGANGSSTFSGAGVGISTTSTLCVYVIADILSGAAVGDTIELQITNPNTDVVVSSGTIGPDHIRAISGTTTIDEIITTLGNGASPTGNDIGPGNSAELLDNFTLQRNTGSTTATALTVSLAGGAGSYENIERVEIKDDSGVTDQCTDITNPVSNTLNFTGCSLSVTTSSTQFKVYITPKTHANMPAIPGARYDYTSSTVTSVTVSAGAVTGTDSTSAAITIDNQSPTNATSTSGSSGDGSVTLNWTASNLSGGTFGVYQSVVLRWAASTPGAEVPVEGTSYTAGNTIGTASVACVLASSQSQVHSGIIDGTGGTAGCNTSALTNNQAYSYKVFQADAFANYDSGVTFTGSPFTPTGTTTLGDGTDPSNVTIAPGTSITDIDQFTFTTGSGSDTITALTVTLSANSFNNIAQVDITDTSNVARCTAVTNPASTTVSFNTCNSNGGVTAGTGGDTYKIRITPKTHTNMPAVPGAEYATTATVTNWTGTNTHAGSDTDSATITVDNASPGAVTGGVFAGASASDYAYSVANDSTYMYILGQDSTPDWRIEKRLLSNGSLVSGFGTSGVATGALSSNFARSIAIDSTYMYVGGNDSSNDLRIEKRLLSDGSLVGGFGTSGVVTGDATSLMATSITIDSTYMYVGALNDDAGWRVEKRLLSDGSLVGGFGTSGVASPAADGDELTLAVDSSYIYLAGSISSGDWRMEKRLISDGSLVGGFGTSGVVSGDATTNHAFDLATDSTYMYVVGSNSSNDWRIEKRLLSDGSLVGGFGTSGVATGAAAGSDPVSVAIDSTNMYIAGYDSNVDWRMEKRLLSDGSLVGGFGTSGVVTGDSSSTIARSVVIDTTNMYVVGDDATPDWRIEKRLLSTGAMEGPTAIPGDTVVDLAWVNPVDSDFTTSGTVVVLRRATSAVADVPVEGTTYTVGNTIGTATVACVVTGSPPATTCQDSSLSNGTAYHYEIFTQDSRGNYDAGTVPTGSPVTPIAPGISLSGTAYQNDGTTPISAKTIALRVNGTLTGTGDGGTGLDDTNGSGVFSFTSVAVSAGDTVTLYLNGETEIGNTIFITDGSTNISTIPVYDDHLILTSNNASNAITILDLLDYDNDQNATDMVFDAEDAAPDTLVVEDGAKLLIYTGDTFTPAGTVTTDPSSSASSKDGDLEIQSGATLNMETNALSIGGDFVNAGTFSESGSPHTTTFTSTATGHTIDNGTGNFDKIVLNGSGGGWYFADASNTIADDLTVTAGTLSGTTNITVNGGDVTGNGTINLTGGTFTVNSAGSFGGDTAWTFSSLTIGGAANATTTAAGTGGVTVSSVLTIDASDTLNAGSKTWTLSGSGAPFVIDGTFTASSSTFVYKGTSATTITAGTYNVLELGTTSDSTAVTYTAAAGTITVGSNLTIGNASDSATKDILQLDTNDPTLDVNGNVTITAGGSFTASATATTNFGGNYTNNGTFTHSSGTITFDATSTGHTLSGTLSLSSGFHNVIFNGSGGGWSNSATLLVDADLTITAGTLSGTSNIVVSGNLTGNGIMNLTGGFLSLSGNGNFGGDTDWTFYDIRFGDTVGTDATTTTGTNTITVTHQLLVRTGHTLNAGSKTFVLTGSTTPLLAQTTAPNDGIFNAQTSTIRHTATSAINIVPLTYYNLSLSPAGSVTYTLGNASSQTIRTDGTFLMDPTSGTLVVTAATYNPALDIRGDLTIASDATYTKGSGTTTFQGGVAQVLTDNNSSKQDLGAVATATASTSVSTATNIKLSSLNIAGSTTWDISGDTMEITGTGTPLSVTGTFTVTGSTVSYSGATANLTATTYNNLTLGSGTYTAPAGTITIHKDLTNGGTFTHNSGTVVFDDSAQITTISGATSFNNLTVTTANKTVKFTSGQTFTTNGLLTLTGTAGNNVIITSSDGTTQFTINHQGTESVDYVTVSYSACHVSSTDIDTTNSTEGTSVGDCWLITQPLDLTLYGYRWRKDNADQDSASYVVAENTPLISGVYIGDNRRLRMSVANTGGGTATDIAYRLEYSSGACASWSQVPNSGDNSGPWVMTSSTHVTNASATTDEPELSNPAGKSFVAGYLMTTASEGGLHTMTNAQFTELEYSVKTTANVVADTMYCFRVTNAGSATGFTYSYTPQLRPLALTFIPRSGGGGGSESSTTPDPIQDQGSGGGAGGSGSESSGNPDTPTGGGSGGGTPPADGDSGYVPGKNNLATVIASAPDTFVFLQFMFSPWWW